MAALSTNVINGTDYLAIATYYADARTSNLGSVIFLYDAVYKIVLSTQVYATLDLVQEFWNSYQVNADIFRSPSTYLSAVRAINNHVINRSGSLVSSVNDYLANEAIKVPMGWAELCKNTGVIICQSHISDLPSDHKFSDGTAIPTVCA